MCFLHKESSYTLYGRWLYKTCVHPSPFQKSLPSRLLIWKISLLLIACVWKNAGPSPKAGGWKCQKEASGESGYAGSLSAQGPKGSDSIAQIWEPSELGTLPRSGFVLHHLCWAATHFLEFLSQRAGGNRCPHTGFIGLEGVRCSCNVHTWKLGYKQNLVTAHRVWLTCWLTSWMAGMSPDQIFHYSCLISWARCV